MSAIPPAAAAPFKICVVVDQKTGKADSVPKQANDKANKVSARESLIRIKNLLSIILLAFGISCPLNYAALVKNLQGAALSVEASNTMALKENLKLRKTNEWKNILF